MERVKKYFEAKNTKAGVGGRRISFLNIGPSTLPQSVSQDKILGKEL